MAKQKVNIPKDETMDAKDFLKQMEEALVDADTVVFPSVEKKDSLTERNISLPIRNTTAEQKMSWNGLKKVFKEEYSGAVLGIMDDLLVTNKKEFIRIYIKLLEHIEPKLIRTDGSKGEVKDNEIIITVKQIGDE
jgi:hypothetical protein